MPCGLVFESRVDQKSVFGCEAQLHAGRNALFFAVLLPGILLLIMLSLASGTSTTVWRPETSGGRYSIFCLKSMSSSSSCL